MPKKRGFTVEEHRREATILKQVYEGAIKLQVSFGRAYGKTNEPALSLEKAIKDLLSAKHAADEIYCKEVPPPANSPYFGAIDKPNSNN